ncbi:unnamed protein product [Prunus armeniaca]
MEFWLKDGIAPVYLTLSLSRASLSLSSGSRPPPQPATFWPAVHSSGHHLGRDRSQNDRPDSAVLPHPFSDVCRQRYRRKLQKNGLFLPRFSGARSGDSGHQILRSRIASILSVGGLIFEFERRRSDLRISRGDSGHFRCVFPAMGYRFGHPRAAGACGGACGGAWALVPNGYRISRIFRVRWDCIGFDGLYNGVPDTPEMPTLVLSLYKLSGRAIMSDPTVRSGPNLQDVHPRACRTYRNFWIGVWRLWALQARLTLG